MTKMARQNELGFVSDAHELQCFVNARLLFRMRNCDAFDFIGFRLVTNRAVEQKDVEPHQSLLTIFSQGCVLSSFGVDHVAQTWTGFLHVQLGVMR